MAKTLTVNMDKQSNQRRIDLSTCNFIYLIVFLCFLLSGISGLIYEVVWIRMLTYVFGGTTLAVSTVLTAFMGGLAIGSYLGGKFIDHYKKPLLAYGVLELAIGIYGLFVPIIFSNSFLAPIWQTVVQMFENFQFVSYLVRFFISVILLAIPTIAMGATLPVLSRYLTNVRSDTIPFNVGGLYTVNTTGAVLGTFLAGFIFLPLTGVTATTYIACTLNLILALAVILLAVLNKKIQADTPKTELEKNIDLEALVSESEEEIPLPLIKQCMFAFAISGFVALVLEVVWTRTLTLVFGSSTYAFSTMLVTFLAGIAIGTLIMTKIAEKIERPVLWIGVLLCGIGVTSFITACFFNELPWMFLSQAQKLPDDVETSWFYLSTYRFLISSFIMFPPTLLSGMLFPLIVKVYSSRPDHIGESVGKLYFLNTLGAIIGSFASGFILIPFFGIFGSGIQTTTRLVILLAVAYGLYLIYNDFKGNENLTERQLKISTSWIYISGVVSLISTFLLMPAWDKSLMTTGVAIYHSLSYKSLSREQFFELFRFDKIKEKIKFYKEGLTTVVSVTADEKGNTTLLKNNGKVDAGVPLDGDGPSQADMVTQVLLGELPVLLHKKEPKNALVIGLGSGCTTGSVIRYPSIKDVKVCEIEKGVIDSNKLFEPPIDKSPLDGNGSPLNKARNLLAKKVKAIHTDGRNYLLTTREKFDIIISQPADPWVTGASQLFTKEFWDLGSNHLKKDGLFCEWIQLYSITPEYLGVLINTFKQSFGKYKNGKKVKEGYVFMFRPGTAGEILLIGSNDPIEIDVEKIEQRIKTSYTLKSKGSKALEVNIKDDLSRISILDAVDIVGELLLGNEEVTALSKELSNEVSRLSSLPLEKRINTDDNVLIEFDAPKKLHLFYAPISDNLISIGKATDGSIDKYLTNYGKTNSQKADFLAKVAVAHAKKASIQESSKILNDPNLKTASYLAKKAIELHPSVVAYIANYTLQTKIGNELEADHYFEKAKSISPVTVDDWISLGQIRATDDNLDGAIAAFQRAVQIDPSSDKAWSKLGEAVFNKAQETNSRSLFDESLKHFKKASSINKYNVEAYSGEANVYFSYASRFKDFQYIPQAEETYKKSFRADLSYWPSRLNYAKILYGQGSARFSEALKEFSHIIRRLNPQNSEARYLSAKILQSQGELFQAYQFYQTAIQLGLTDNQLEDAQQQLQEIQQKLQTPQGAQQANVPPPQDKPIEETRTEEGSIEKTEKDLSEELKEETKEAAEATNKLKSVTIERPKELESTIEVEKGTRKVKIIPPKE